MITIETVEKALIFIFFNLFYFLFYPQKLELHLIIAFSGNLISFGAFFQLNQLFTYA